LFLRQVKQHGSCKKVFDCPKGGSCKLSGLDREWVKGILGGFVAVTVRFVMFCALNFKGFYVLILEYSNENELWKKQKSASPFTNCKRKFPRR
jgi:hypothetical protein